LARVSQEVTATRARSRQGPSGRQTKSLRRISLIVGCQDKRSGTYQHGNENTDNERNNPRSTLSRLRSRTFLRRPDTNQKRRVLMASGAIIVGAWWQS
jgi:hypothetical protein